MWLIPLFLCDGKLRVTIYLCHAHYPKSGMVSVPSMLRVNLGLLSLQFTHKVTSLLWMQTVHSRLFTRFFRSLDARRESRENWTPAQNWRLDAWMWRSSCSSVGQRYPPDKSQSSRWDSVNKTNHAIRWAEDDWHFRLLDRDLTVG